MYHKVAPDTPTMWWVGVDDFKRQMHELLGYQVVSLDDYDPTDPHQAVITFDGLYENVYRYALPVLEDYGYPWEAFITSDYIGRDNEFDSVEPSAKFCDEAQLRDVVRRGGRLQWHSATHRNLQDVHDPRAIERELAIPAQVRELDAKGFKWFAYPHGNFNPCVLELCTAQFRGGVSCHQGNDTDPQILNRITVTSASRLNTARISLIIPTYNYGSFLPEAIESALAQTYPADEILIVDDASNDNSLEIAALYAEQFPNKVRVLGNPENLGIVGTFNRGIASTFGDFVCFLGADNRFRSDYLERTTAQAFSDPRIGIAYTDYALFGPRARLHFNDYPEQWRGRVLDNIFFEVNFPDGPANVAALEKRNFIHGSSLFRRTAIQEAGGYVAREDRPEDYDLAVRIVKCGWTAVKASGGALLEYRQHSTRQANIRQASFAELHTYRQALRRSEEHAREQQARLQSLGSTVSQLEEQLSSAKNAHNDLFNQVARARTLIDDLIGQIDTARAANEDLTAQCNVARSVIADKDAEIARARLNSDDYARQIEQARRLIDGKVAELDFRDAIVSQQKARIERRDQWIDAVRRSFFYRLLMRRNFDKDIPND